MDQTSEARAEEMRAVAKGVGMSKVFKKAICTICDFAKGRARACGTHTPKKRSMGERAIGVPDFFVQTTPSFLFKLRRDPLRPGTCLWFHPLNAALASSL